MSIIVHKLRLSVVLLCSNSQSFCHRHVHSRGVATRQPRRLPRKKFCCHGAWRYVEPAHVAKIAMTCRCGSEEGKTPTIALSVPDVSRVTIPNKKFPRSARARQLLTAVPCLSKQSPRQCTGSPLERVQIYLAARAPFLLLNILMSTCRWQAFF